MKSLSLISLVGLMSLAAVTAERGEAAQDFEQESRELEHNLGDCKDVSGWKDTYGDSCNWYERNDIASCKDNWWEPGGNSPMIAGEACCYCFEEACDETTNWVDERGRSCLWYELNQQPGCPTAGPTGGDFGRTADQACCHCQCEDMDDWKDDDGDGCDWYYANDEKGCPAYGALLGSGIAGDRIPAEKACCWCRDGRPETMAPTAAPTITKEVECADGGSWVDQVGFACTWYEDNQKAGCPDYWFYPGVVSGEDAIAADGCCHCGEDKCSNYDDWVDVAGFTCSWYESGEVRGCPKWSWYPDKDGITAEEACCHCQCENMVDWKYGAGDDCEWFEKNDQAGCPTYGDLQGESKTLNIKAKAREACCHCRVPEKCAFGDGWIDDTGESCEWYERNAKPGCPKWWWYPGIGDKTVQEGCCFCDPDSCANTAGWVDKSGFTCEWYEENEKVGCPTWRTYESKDGVKAEDACCHCKCENRAGWKDNTGFTCEWYENNEPRGCPTWGGFLGTVGNNKAIPAREACCHCGYAAPDDTIRPNPAPTPKPNPAPTPKPNPAPSGPKTGTPVFGG